MKFLFLLLDNKVVVDCEQVSFVLFISYRKEVQHHVNTWTKAKKFNFKENKSKNFTRNQDCCC